jgi:DNA modification methylase
MNNIHQQRNFLLLEDDTERNALAKRILASPLGLAQDIVSLLFEENFHALEDTLDSIKKFAAGVHRAHRFAPDYTTAGYYTLMFSFHQFFHSSYRARQGKVLEEVLKTILREYTNFSLVPDSVSKEMLPLLQKSFRTSKPLKNDIGVMGMNPQTHRMILMQLRSRDDTGGTTAKGSLVDLLRTLLRMQKTPDDQILYLVCIWDQRDAQQRESTIEKIYASLRDWTNLDRQAFENIGRGIPVAKRITLKMAYGIDEILGSIFEWDKAKHGNLNAVREIVETVENWDDLWIAYALASLEIGVKTLHGASNVQLLNQKCAMLNFEYDFTSYAALQQDIDQATPHIAALWKEDTLPVQSVSDQTLYIRDLLFLRAIYQKSQQKSKKKVARETAGIYYQTRLLDLPHQVSTIPTLISFRSLVPEIEDTTYLTHALYYYPAKFIPQVVRYCIREYSPKGGWIVDPFAGSATVGLESFLCQRNAILLDLNPLLTHIVQLKIQVRQTDLDERVLQREIETLKRSQITFLPDWSNLAYWYPPQILEKISRYWGWQRQMEPSPYKLILQAALLKASKQFSYAEHRTPKLFKSKSKLAEMERLLQQDWQTLLDDLIARTAFDALERVRQLARLTQGYDSQIIAYGGVDSTEFRWQEQYPVDCVLTSPPYLQAQEYIRTSKLDLYWLGYSEDDIKRLSKLEIPYRRADRIIETPTLNDIRQQITRADLRALLDAYFCYTLKALENAAQTLRPQGHACIFVGNPKLDGIEIETWRIILEYFSERRFSLVHVLEDRIKNRQLFGRRKNKNPEGMKSEFLLVLQAT